jgi:hypothetical protein
MKGQLKLFASGVALAAGFAAWVIVVLLVVHEL